MHYHSRGLSDSNDKFNSSALGLLNQPFTHFFTILFLCFLSLGEQEVRIEVNQVLYEKHLRRVVEDEVDDLEAPGKILSMNLLKKRKVSHDLHIVLELETNISEEEVVLYFSLMLYFCTINVYICFFPLQDHP